MEYTIKVNGKEYKAVLKEPNFTDFRMAQMASSFNGQYDSLAAGSSLIQHCWLSGSEELKDGDSEKASPDVSKAYATLAAEVYNDIFLSLDAEIKKK